MTPTFVIVGAGLAGAKAAETLREEGFDGRLVLIGSEDARPYERPPLSKGYLRGETRRDEVDVHDEGFYREHDIELRLGAVATDLDAGRRRLTLGDGSSVGYDRLLLATGARPRRLDVPGADLDGVLHLRDVADSDALRERFARGGHVVVVGAGWIGSEVAASARERGLDVTVIDPMAVPLERVLGTEVGSVFRDLHADHGVRLRMGAGVEAIEGATCVERVRTTGGGTVDCDSVVVGVGVEPRMELAARAGIAIDDGIVVDEHLRTSAPGVFAAGDVASARHPFYGRHIRVEHWANALHQGPAAARAMLGGTEPFDRLPFFFSDQYDTGMEYAGHARAWDRVVLRGDVASRELIAFWIADHRVVAAMNLNVWDVTESLQRLIRDRLVVEDRHLADPAIAIDELIAAPHAR